MGLEIDSIYSDVPGGKRKAQRSKALTSYNYPKEVILSDTLRTRIIESNGNRQGLSIQNPTGNGIIHFAWGTERSVQEYRDGVNGVDGKEGNADYGDPIFLTTTVCHFSLAADNHLLLNFDGYFSRMSLWAVAATDTNVIVVTEHF